VALLEEGTQPGQNQRGGLELLVADG